MAKFFKKLYTSQKELIDDDFPELDNEKIGDNLGLKLITHLKNPSNGFTFKTTGFKHPNGDEVDGTLESEIKCSNYDLTLKGKFQTSNKYEATLSLNDKLVKGSTLFVTGRAELGSKPKETVELGFDYLNKEYATFNLKFISPFSFKTEDLEIYTAGVGYFQGVHVGGDVQFKPVGGDGIEVSKSNGYLQYDNSGYSTALFGKYDKKKELKLDLDTSKK